MNKIKNLIRNIIGDGFYSNLTNGYINLRELNVLIKNNYVDGKLFYKHSMVFKQDTFSKIESKIVLHYHAIEKGFLHTNFRYRFAEARVKDLVKLLSMEEVLRNRKRSQIAAAYLAMCKYYERHEINKIDISDFFQNKDYEVFKKATSLNLEIIKNHDNGLYFDNVKSDFYKFSWSRASVRSFTGAKIPLDKIQDVISLAKNAPSVCNRQPTKVYYVQEKEKIDNVLKIQGGLTGYTEEITQLLVVVSDRNYFYSIGERNQLYVDGGIFVMNLLYALHYYEIAACPAHWGHNVDKDKEIMNAIPLSESEKVICVIPIGVPKNDFKTTLSLRRENHEILQII